LSFQNEHKEELIKRDISTYLLKAIDGVPDSDPIKYNAVIALANLSSHKDFLKQGLSDDMEDDNVEKTGFKIRCLIKPLIHILDNNDVANLNLI